MAVVALIALVAAIVIGTWRHINIGIMGIIFACILGIIAGIPAGQLAAGFNSMLFLRLLAVQLLVCIAKQNGTIDTLAKKLVKVGCGKSVKLLPIILFFAFLFCGTVGIDTVFLVTPFLVAIAYEAEIDPMAILISMIFSFQGIGMSPLAVTGVNAYSNAEQAGLSVNSWNALLLTWISSTVLFFIFYFIFGWHKQKPVTLTGMETAKFDRNQVLTLLGFAAYVVMTLVLGWDIMVAPAVISLVLLVLNAADSKKVIADIPWGILIMISGMSVLASVVVDLGGVDLLSGVLSKVSVSFLAAPLMGLIGGAMSFFSSGNGVVIPTLVPTIPSISAATSASAQAMLISLCLGAGCTGMSPMSTIGGHIMSCYGAIYKPSEEQRTIFFNRMMVFCLICLVAQAVVALTGFYSLQIIH